MYRKCLKTGFVQKSGKKSPVFRRKVFIKKGQAFCPVGLFVFQRNGVLDLRLSEIPISPVFLGLTVKAI